MSPALQVGFATKKFRGCKVAKIEYVGRYRGEDMLRSEFNEIKRWAKEKGVKTGRWFFMELDGPEVPDKKRRWVAAIEIKGEARSKGKIRVTELAPSTIVCVKFDPEAVSAELVYFGLGGWVDWHKKEGKYKENGTWREVYLGDPWTSKRAWANLEIQVPVKRV